MTRKCWRCPSTEFRRINREGFFQQEILAKLGFFPWECVLCRRHRFFHDDGLHTSPDTRLRSKKIPPPASRT